MKFKSYLAESKFKEYFLGDIPAKDVEKVKKELAKQGIKPNQVKNEGGGTYFMTFKDQKDFDAALDIVDP